MRKRRKRLVLCTKGLQMREHIHVINPYPLAWQSAGNLGLLHFNFLRRRKHPESPSRVCYKTSSRQTGVFLRALLNLLAHFKPDFWPGVIPVKSSCSCNIKFLILHLKTSQLLCFWDNRPSFWSPSQWCKLAVTQLKYLKVCFCSRNKHLTNIIVTQSAVLWGKY